jgi:hypothetical protein
LLNLIKSFAELSSNYDNIRLEGVEMTGEISEELMPIEGQSDDVVADGTEQSFLFFRKMLPNFRNKQEQKTQEKKELINDLFFKIEFNHPGIVCCSTSSDGVCGFVIKHSKLEGLDYTLELCEEEKVYNENSVHLHDEIDVRDMHWYMVMSVQTQGGVRVEVPVSRLGWWWRMWLLGCGDGWRLEKACVVDYDISSYLVAK